MNPCVSDLQICVKPLSTAQSAVALPECLTLKSQAFSKNFSNPKDKVMNKLFAALIAGLFATGAFASTAAPAASGAKPAASAAKPAASAKK